MLADQMLERLELLHEKGVVHRDIKPGNFVLGRGSTSSCVYLIDFGLAHKYRSGGVHIKYEENVPFRGTHRYASINAHMKIEQTRRDDLESLGYVLIYFLKGGLPWQNLNVERNRRRQVIGDLKKNTSVHEITSDLPPEFAKYLNAVRNLEFEEKPDYKILRALFKKCYSDQNFPQDGLFDWSQTTSPSPGNNPKKRKMHDSKEIEVQTKKKKLTQTTPTPTPTSTSRKRSTNTMTHTPAEIIVISDDDS